MIALDTNQRRLVGILALAVAGALGFTLAKMTTKPTPSSIESRSDAAEASGSTGKLEMDESHLAAVGIELETVTPGNLGAEIRAPANVSSAPEARAIVTAHATGTVIGID